MIPWLIDWSIRFRKKSEKIEVLLVASTSYQFLSLVLVVKNNIDSRIPYLFFVRVPQGLHCDAVFFLFSDRITQLQYIIQNYAMQLCWWHTNAQGVPHTFLFAWRFNRNIKQNEPNSTELKHFKMAWRSSGTTNDEMVDNLKRKYCALLRVQDSVLLLLLLLFRLRLLDWYQATSAFIDYSSNIVFFLGKKWCESNLIMQYLYWAISYVWMDANEESIPSTWLSFYNEKASCPSNSSCLRGRKAFSSFPVLPSCPSGFQIILSLDVEAGFRSVDRELFVPKVSHVYYGRVLTLSFCCCDAEPVEHDEPELIVLPLCCPCLKFHEKLSKEIAHKDQPIRENNIHISAPHIYGSVIEALDLKKGAGFSVLNAGSGTGYLTCIAASILGPRSVHYCVEIHEDVIRHCKEAIAAWEKTNDQGTSNIDIIHGNALELNTNKGECAFGFDRIYIGAAIHRFNLHMFKKMLKPGGVLVGPGEFYIPWTTIGIIASYVFLLKPY